MYALHCGLLPLNTSSPLSVTTCHISAPPLLYLSRAAGLSRLSCVTDFRIATAFYPCGGRAPSNRPGLVCLLAVPPIDALPTYAVSFRGESSPVGMVAGFRPPRPRLSGVSTTIRPRSGIRNRTGRLVLYKSPIPVPPCRRVSPTRQGFTFSRPSTSKTPFWVSSSGSRKT